MAGKNFFPDKIFPLFYFHKKTEQSYASCAVAKFFYCSIIEKSHGSRGSGGKKGSFEKIF